MRAITVSLSMSDDDIRRFRSDGFLIVPDVLSSSAVAGLRERFPLLFAGKFDTGVYPDEWYWRENLSRPDVTRHMANAWKSDLTIAQLALSRQLAEAAGRLAGWSGTRLGQDTLWWKPPGTKAIAHHQDTSFMDFFDPPTTVTCWVALDDTAAQAGTLEYARGSHKWPLSAIPTEFHASERYRAPMEHAARLAGMEPELTYVIVRAGSCAFHAGELWHGSGPNTSDSTMRRSIGLHFLSSHTRFSNRAGGYIYRRYQRAGCDALDESFFPLLWSEKGERTDWIGRYLATGRR